MAVVEAAWGPFWVGVQEVVSQSDDAQVVTVDGEAGFRSSGAEGWVGDVGARLWKEQLLLLDDPYPCSSFQQQRQHGRSADPWSMTSLQILRGCVNPSQTCHPWPALHCECPFRRQTL